MTELSKKVSLTQAISTMQRIFPNDYKFYPPSFFLPADYNNLKEFCQRKKMTNRNAGSSDDIYFIVKPDDGSQGAGIYLVSDPSEIKDPSQKQLVQEYVSDPFLMEDKLKFDFRVYGVIGNINPLSIYVSREGMVRFCTEKYCKPSESNFGNLYAHLTNYSLNKANLSYVHSSSIADQENGSKRLLSTVLHQMARCGLQVKRLWRDIKCKSGPLKRFHDFSLKIIGFDIIVREDGSPILLEVNSAPSLTIDHSPNDGVRMKSVIDELIKVPLVRDTLLLVTDQLPNPNRRNGTEAAKNGNDRTSATYKDNRKPHLTEIFPNRYGYLSSHLLFVDNMVYIYMHFANLGQSLNISTSSLRRLFRECGLLRYVDPTELDAKISEISRKFTGDPTNSKGAVKFDSMGRILHYGGWFNDNGHRHPSLHEFVREFSINVSNFCVISGLPYHGFTELMIFAAERTLPESNSIVEQLKNVFFLCDSALRWKGVRSRRLRREEVEVNFEDGQ
ncbi:unnamed protein product [Nippostrongylus brasiliensis]|uniref:Tubulin polyglutamylase TTLL11 (inferred by orthology to a human protein) n=1 Tax=Nippostrongylus brasiliensis TaxID=27835 RepID=A0A0N4Y5A8_NIPBR|nr:unnamed protein product [Nippostrongylus brasiliensis]